MIGQNASRSMSKKVKYKNCSDVLDQALAMNLKTLISSRELCLKYQYGNPAQDTLTLAPLFQIVLQNYASFSESFLCISVVQQYHTTAVLNSKPRPLCPLFLRLYAFMWGWKTQLKNND